MFVLRIYFSPYWKFYDFKEILNAKIQIKNSQLKPKKKIISENNLLIKHNQQQLENLIVNVLKFFRKLFLLHKKTQNFEVSEMDIKISQFAEPFMRMNDTIILFSGFFTVENTLDPKKAFVFQLDLMPEITKDDRKYQKKRTLDIKSYFKANTEKKEIFVLRMNLD